MNKETNSLNNKRLSIQLSSDGFSFCVYNLNTNVYEHFTHIEFSYPLNHPDALLNEVNKIFETNDLLHLSYNETFLIHHNHLNTFVPHTYFDESILHQYLENTVKTFSNDFVSYDAITSIEANNVYIPFVNINNFIFDTFGEFTYLHSASVFLENIVKNNNSNEKEMFVNVYKNNFQLLVLENNNLILSNNFNFNTKEDFVYYILFVAEQLKMNPNEFVLTLYGSIQQDDENYTLLYNYVRNVHIYAKLNTQLNETIHCLPQEHYNLLQLHI